MMGSVWQYYHARSKAFRIINGKHAGIPPENESWEEMEAREAEIGGQYVTRDELFVHDLVKQMACLFFMFSMVAIGMGKMGKRASWRQMAWSTAEISRTSLKMLVVMIILGLVLKSDKDELHTIKRRYKMQRK